MARVREGYKGKPEEARGKLAERQVVWVPGTEEVQKGALKERLRRGQECVSGHQEGVVKVYSQRGGDDVQPPRHHCVWK